MSGSVTNNFHRLFCCVLHRWASSEPQAGPSEFAGWGSKKEGLSYHFDLLGEIEEDFAKNNSAMQIA